MLRYNFSGTAPYWTAGLVLANGPTHLLSHHDELRQFVVDLGTELGVLLGPVLHELGVARDDLGAELGVPISPTQIPVHRLFSPEMREIRIYRSNILTECGDGSESMF